MKKKIYIITSMEVPSLDGKSTEIHPIIKTPEGEIYDIIAVRTLLLALLCGKVEILKYATTTKTEFRVSRQMIPLQYALNKNIKTPNQNSW